MGRWNALGKPAIDGSSITQTLIKCIRHYSGAFLRAGAAPCAFVFLNVAGLPANRDFKVSGVAFYLFNFAIGHQFNIGMSTDIQHLGRKDSDGTVIGWKGLVQLGHLAADTG